MAHPPEKEVWKQWYEENSARLLLYARQQTRTSPDAEDVLQEAFVRMWDVAHREPDLGLPNLPFAYTSIRRCAIDMARKNLRRDAREEAAILESDHVQWFESALETEERNAILEKAMKALKPEYQEVLTLKLWGEMTFQAIADMQQISINTVASRYRYALQALRKELQNAPSLFL